jgi:hypothetical protein
MEDLWQSPPCVSVFVQLPCGVSPTYHGTQAGSIVYAICFAPQPSSIKIHVFLLLGKAVSCAVLRPTLSTYEWALSLEYFLTNRVLTVYVQLIIFCGNTFPHFRLCSAQVCESYKPDQSWPTHYHPCPLKTEHGVLLLQHKKGAYRPFVLQWLLGFRCLLQKLILLCLSALRLKHFSKQYLTKLCFLGNSDTNT